VGFSRKYRGTRAANLQSDYFKVPRWTHNGRDKMSTTCGGERVSIRHHRDAWVGKTDVCWPDVCISEGAALYIVVLCE